jgi:hypothetical protein
MALVDAWGRSSRLCLSISGFMKLCMTSKIASQISSIGDHLVQALDADRLADRLLGIEKLVDVGLGESDRLGEIGDRRLAVAVAAEMRPGRIHDLVADVMFGRTASAGHGG